MGRVLCSGSDYNIFLSSFARKQMGGQDPGEVLVGTAATKSGKGSLKRVVSRRQSLQRGFFGLCCESSRATAHLPSPYLTRAGG